jgi:hypothetical protein
MTKCSNDAKNKGSPKPDDEFISLVYDGKNRVGLRVMVEPAPELELQTFNLAESIYECQNVAVELLANLISMSDSTHIRIADFEAKGIKLIHSILLSREPQAVENLVTTFGVENEVTDYGVFTTLRFKCGVPPLMVSTLRNNGGLSGYVH